MSKHHRFTGRELSALLEQVRDELGAEATILEANKVRTGGVAGFFKTEKYEVVAAAAGDGDDDITLPAADGVEARTLRLDLVEPDGSPAPSFQLPDPDDPADTTSRIDLRTAIDEVQADRFRDDTVDIRTPLPSTLPPATRPIITPFDPPLADAPIVASPRGADAIPSYFDTMAAEATGATALLDRSREADVQPLQSDGETATSPASGVGAPIDGQRFGDVLTAELQQPDIMVRSTSTDAFWDQLADLDERLHPVELESRVVTIVGNRRSALAVARRIMTTADDQPALAAISPTPDDLDLPAWQLIDTATELEDRLRFWDRSQRSAVVIIDADLGEDATTMVERVRAGGSTLLRLTIDDALPAERIRTLMARLGGDVVIDLTFRPAPDYVLALIDGGVTLATIEGHPADAGLVLALRQAADRG